MVREQLGFDRHTFGKFLGLTAKEVYYIELGRLPSENVLKRLKQLDRFTPVLDTLSNTLTTLLSLTAIPIGIFKRLFLHHLWWYQGKMETDGQLVLECCTTPRHYLFLTIPLRLFLVMARTWLYCMILTGNVVACLMLLT